MLSALYPKMFEKIRSLAMRREYLKAVLIFGGAVFAGLLFFHAPIALLPSILFYKKIDLFT